MTNALIEPALKVCKAMDGQSGQKLPSEILVLNSDTVAIVMDIEGVDYILTMMRVPQQRPRPTSQ